MSKGFGAVQRAALAAIERREAAWAGEPKIEDFPTTYTVACDGYEVPADANGSRLCNDAQHAAIRRALLGLERAGLVVAVRPVGFCAPGMSGHEYRQNVWVTPAGRERYSPLHAAPVLAA
jgi:hypothetical protein